jgi:acetyltransferase-like isoleucine patch superfamily enzyme
MNIRIYFIEKISVYLHQYRYLKLRLKGYKNINSRAIIESQVLLDKVNPSGICIGAGTLVAARSIILSHEHIYRDAKNSKLPFTTNTIIGKNCFIGIGATILPGVNIGDECVIGAGSVVTKDVPSNAMAAGVPAKIIKTEIKMNDRAEIIFGEINMNIERENL